MTETNTPSHFLRTIIEADLAAGLYTTDNTGTQRPIVTRFPPEPNGYLHIGHAKSICLNFGLARDYQGRCYLRFDDTNPEKENVEYVDTIKDSVRWLGFDWVYEGREHLYYASDYFDQLYAFAEYLIEADLAYVDSQTAEAIAANRGSFSEAGKNSPFRNRAVAESLHLFRQMKAGTFQDGEHVLRAKISEDAMAHPNMNMRDPILYRIRHAHHHRTGDTWCIYPMYDFTHPLSDAIEQISHSICTLEFQDHRPLYDWLVSTGKKAGLFTDPLPHQYEFARLNLTYVVTSKRKLRQLVESNVVSGWDDPRLPTLVGIRRRGYTPESIRLFCERIGVARSDAWVEYSTLESCLREDLDPKAPRAIAVLRPLKLIIDNFPDDHDPILCTAPIHPHQPERGHRTFYFSKTCWIERDDFMASPTKGYFRLYKGNKVRLRYAFVVECTHYDQDEAGNIIAVHCTYFPDSQSGTPGSALYKVKGNIHWVSAAHAVKAEVRLYDRLFTDPHPDTGNKDFTTLLNPDSLETVSAYLEAPIETAQPGQSFQFERHGYFVADSVYSQPNQLVFNRITTLKDSFGKSSPG